MEQSLWHLNSELTSLHVDSQGMEDTSDITRPRDVTMARPKTNQFGYTSTGDVSASADLFTKPFIQDLPEELLGMFTFTMKKRKYPFESNSNADEDDIEQTRRMSEVSVCDLLRNGCELQLCSVLCLLGAIERQRKHGFGE